MTDSNVDCHYTDSDVVLLLTVTQFPKNTDSGVNTVNHNIDHDLVSHNTQLIR